MSLPVCGRRLFLYLEIFTYICSFGMFHSVAIVFSISLGSPELDRAIPADLAPRLEAVRLPLHVPRSGCRWYAACYILPSLFEFLNM
jgi:hypothetical protein